MLSQASVGYRFLKDESDKIWGISKKTECYLYGLNPTICFTIEFAKSHGG